MKKEIKANTNIFERLKIIDVADMLTLSPINPGRLETEANFYLINSSNLALKNILPGAYVKDIKEAKKNVMEFIDRMIAYDSILYCIRLKESNVPIGYILLNSPLSQNGLNEWSIDFWLNENYRGKKIMASSLMQLLGHMQQMEIKIAYAMVDKDNFKSKSLIEKFGFSFINENENSGRHLMLYGLRLND